MELFKDTHLVKLELLSNATTIDSALHYIRNKQQQQKQQQEEIVATAASTINQVLLNIRGVFKTTKDCVSYLP
jgi:hypothetical protein